MQLVSLSTHFPWRRHCNTVYTFSSSSFAASSHLLPRQSSSFSKPRSSPLSRPRTCGAQMSWLFTLHRAWGHACGSLLIPGFLSLQSSTLMIAMSQIVMDRPGSCTASAREVIAELTGWNLWFPHHEEDWRYFAIDWWLNESQNLLVGLEWGLSLFVSRQYVMINSVLVCLHGQVTISSLFRLFLFLLCLSVPFL